uniref:Putative secreted protein n=1 Tax=Anopheles marajoara TaxID=58244 RepID=A0A2M4C7C7_9DIPT
MLHTLFYVFFFIKMSCGSGMMHVRPFSSPIRSSISKRYSNRNVVIEQNNHRIRYEYGALRHAALTSNDFSLVRGVCTPDISFLFGVFSFTNVKSYCLHRFFGHFMHLNCLPLLHPRTR